MQIIQFLHPGAEHNCQTGSNWNTSSHKRKYIELSGKYLADLKSEPISAEKLYFWGEWEAQSHCRAINAPIPNGPEFIFNPFYHLPLPVNAANTDPFVFGNQFYYCICKQAHYPSLRSLKPGDILLFGSCKNKEFVLDTVFVVKDKKSYKISQLKSTRTNYNKEFSDVSLSPLEQLNKAEKKEIVEHDNLCIPLGCDDETDYCAAVNEDEYFVYEAVMYEDRDNFNGIFSYSPCLSNEHGERAFPRPQIVLLAHISQTLNQGLKVTTTQDTQQVWQSVTEQVIKQGLGLMIENTL